MKKHIILVATGMIMMACSKDDEVAVTKVEIEPSSVRIEVGENFTFTATVSPDNATNKTVTWSCDNPDIATIDESGTVVGVSVGNALITAIAGVKKWVSEVTVVAATVRVTGVTIDPPTLLLNTSDEVTLTAVISPPNATNQAVSWESNNTAVATVNSSSGKVTGVTMGTATITVTTIDGGKTATCPVTVEVATIPVTGVTISPPALSLGTGGKSMLTAVISPANATNQAVSWTSDNTAVATVNSSSGEVTGVTAGPATITVTTADGGKTATCPVTVTAFADFTDQWAGNMVAVAGGTMTMPIGGTTVVNINSFYMGKYEVTQKIWETVVKTLPQYAANPWPNSAGPNDTYGRGDDYPAQFISHDNIMNIFLPALNALTGKNYRLPTEAEWEYAARGGQQSQGFTKYSGSDDITAVAWFGPGGSGCSGNNSGGKSHPVGLLAGNELGLHDMTGNLWEWCYDWYDATTYPSGTDNPTGPTTGTRRVLKGGSWQNNCTTTIQLPYRNNAAPNTVDGTGRHGFRLALDK
ncbi:MAG: Ig-like domain-containing protein [Tannerella sp.]|nr:Ig-like domain-containing protein [Tannerella sp.]